MDYLSGGSRGRTPTCSSSASSVKRSAAFRATSFTGGGGGKAGEEGEGRSSWGEDGVECNAVYIEGRKKGKMNLDRSIVGYCDNRIHVMELVSFQKS